MWVYCFIFIILAMLAVEHEVRPIQRVNFVLIILTVVLSLFAGLRDVSVSRDYEPYLGSFNAIIHGGSDGGSGLLPLFEPAFVWIVIISYHLFEMNGAVTVMLVFAFLSMSTKMYAIKRLAINPFLVLLLYYCHFYFFQEMTQIRNGMACSLFFLALLYYLENKKIRVLLLIGLAILFHNSAVLYLLIFLLRKDTLNVYLYSALFLLAIGCGVMKIPFLSMMAGFDLNLISNKLTTYKSIAETGVYDNIRFFNVINLFNVALTGYLLIYCKKHKLKDPALILYIKCNIVSLLMYGLLIDVPSIATRFMELFGAVFPFLFAYGTRMLPFGKFNIYFLIAFAAGIMYINLFYGKLLAPYAIIPFK